jgi:hypothetical protein
MIKNSYLKSKLSNIKSNNSTLQIADNKINDVNITVNNFYLSSNDLNIENKSFFDNLTFSNETSVLNCPINNFQFFEKSTKQNVKEEKINKNKLMNKFEDSQFYDLKGKRESLEINYELMKLKKSKGNILNKKRKNNNDSKKGHSKYADDNLGRKIKNLILNYTLKFLNEKIKIIYDEKIGNGIFKKKLLPINKSIKLNMSIEYNTNLIHKTLREIFSDNISSKYTDYLKNHNKIIIDKLLNDKDEKIASYFQKLLNITFLQCVRKFSGSNEIKELEGFTKFNDIKNKLFDDSKYIEAMEYYLNNYESKIQKKRRKNKTKSEEGNNGKKSPKKIINNQIMFNIH